MRKNTTKATLAAGGTVAGAIIPFLAPPLVEIAALTGFDFALIDMEHGGMTLETAEHLARVADAAGITPLARIPYNAQHETLRALDIGIQGVMVPQVATVEAARAAASAAKYPPAGTRGLSGGRPADYGLTASMPDYVEHANRETMVMALVEHIDAVGRIDEILDVDGIDVFFIGAGDLAASMGLPGRNDHPDVQAAVTTILERGLARGRTVGLNAPSAEAARSWRERGVRFFCLSPFHHLAAAWQQYTAAVHGR